MGLISMSCVAVFVDAGYLFAQGSTALTGSTKPRSALKLNETAVVAELTSVALTKSNSGRLLRVYWYDGSFSARQSLEHATLAHTDFIKLRLGMMNSQGQQKGVDSLIVTDLIELARNHAITDALLLSGDEDVRIAVQIAQSYGVRVHLLGIAPLRGSQSLLLMQEADTTTEWDSLTVGKFLSVKPQVAITPIVQPAVKSATKSMTSPQPLDATFEAVAKGLLATFDSNDVAQLQAFWAKERGLPSEIDGKLLAQCRTAIGRELTVNERRGVRTYFRQSVPKVVAPEPKK